MIGSCSAGNGGFIHCEFSGCVLLGAGRGWKKQVTGVATLKVSLSPWLHASQLPSGEQPCHHSVSVFELAKYELSPLSQNKLLLL